MKKGDLAIKAVSIVLFAAICCYLGAYLYNSWKNPFRTTVAVPYAAQDGLNVEGIVVRNETVLTSSSDIVDIVAMEGEHIAAGEIIAQIYDSTERLNAATQIRLDEQQIQQLEQLLVLKESGAEVKDMDEDVRKGIRELVFSVNRKDLSGLDEKTTELQTLLFGQGSDAGEISQRIGQLQSEAYSLRMQYGTESREIRVETAGLFCATVDSFESIGPEALEDMSLNELQTLLAQEETSPSDAIGKIIHDINWYYVFAVGDEQAIYFEDCLRAGEKVTLMFGKYYAGTLDMEIERIGDSEDGKKIIVLSCSKAMTDTMDMRKQQADVVIEHYEGIRVPKDAVHVDDDGQTYVYTVTGVQAERKDISILYQVEDLYIVENDLEDPSALRVGDEIVVSAKNLYDGKIIK